MWPSLRGGPIQGGLPIHQISDIFRAYSGDFQSSRYFVYTILHYSLNLHLIYLLYVSDFPLPNYFLFDYLYNFYTTICKLIIFFFLTLILYIIYIFLYIFPILFVLFIKTHTVHHSLSIICVLYIPNNIHYWRGSRGTESYPFLGCFTTKLVSLIT